ncbi:uncharacterized protein LOC129947474 [Eupeodes corollae]|uniref:uncharacterized protein LOC129947474 n=1 Tax=Eupeodes corollae TaxID=290404 RepID=UPI00248F9D7C|nr:uncharacterized protein LOC129947474 [Eupeodes corollae]XP_055914020.1 uncharacterized protein LOC129947474 [Eupeodes corollae]XP_055914021.1 uncharacterized protein LOC129947474 [Eupeodes corollae]
MSAYAEKFQDSNCKELPTSNGFSNWLTSTFQLPLNASTWLAQIVLLMLTWYTMKFTFRLIMSILWPLVIISTVLVIFHSIQHNTETLGLDSYICEKMADLCNLVVRTSVRILRLFTHS